MNAAICSRDKRCVSATCPGWWEIPTSKTVFARSIAMVVFFTVDSSYDRLRSIRDDFGTSMPFQSPGGVHLIICGLADASPYLPGAAAPLLARMGNRPCPIACRALALHKRSLLAPAIPTAAYLLPAPYCETRPSRTCYRELSAPYRAARAALTHRPCRNRPGLDSQHTGRPRWARSHNQ